MWEEEARLEDVRVRADGLAAELERMGEHELAARVRQVYAKALEFHSEAHTIELEEELEELEDEDA